MKTFSALATTLFLSISPVFAGNDSDVQGNLSNIKSVKIMKDIDIKLGEVNQVSKYCYIHPQHDYVVRDTTDWFYYYNVSKSAIKGKTLTLKAGTDLNVDPKSKTDRFPYREYALGRPGPEHYRNAVTILSPYSEIPSKLATHKEAYISLNFVCMSERFSNSMFGDKDKNKVKTRTSYVKDIDENISNYFEFDGGALLLEDEPENHYYN